jgi:hypothetical protein
VWRCQGTTEDAAEKLGFCRKIGENRSSEAEAVVVLIGITRGLKPPSPSDEGFFATCKTQHLFCCTYGTTEVVP